MHLQQLKGKQSSRQGMWKGTICQQKVYERVNFFVKNGIYKGTGLHLGAEPPPINICWVPPPPRSTYPLVSWVPEVFFFLPNSWSLRYSENGSLEPWAVVWCNFVKKKMYVVQRFIGKLPLKIDWFLFIKFIQRNSALSCACCEYAVITLLSV